jgi:hypothetical protein
MGFGSVFKKVFKAPLKIVDTVVDVGTDIVKAPIQVVEDVYQGVRDIGSSAVDVVEGAGSGAGQALQGIGSGIGNLGESPAFAAGTIATGSLAGGGMAALQQQQFENQIRYLRDVGWGNQPIDIPGYERNIMIPGQANPQLVLQQPSQQPLLPTANVQQFSLPLIIGGVGILAAILFITRRKK